MKFDLGELGNKFHEIMELLNEVIDFDRHSVCLLLDKDSTLHKQWQHEWHYLHGFRSFIPKHEALISNQKSSLNLAASKGKIISRKKSYEGKKKGPELWLPLILKDNIIGVLSLGTKPDCFFSQYCQSLCEYIVSLGMQTINDAHTLAVWENLRFSILNRKAYLSGNITIEAASEEYIERCFRLFSENQKIIGTVRLIYDEAVSSGNPDEATIIFQAQRGLSLDIWNQYNKKYRLIKKQAIDNWPQDIQNKIEHSVVDLDPTYLETFQIHSKIHIVIPSLHNKKLVALFTFDSNHENAISKPTIHALAFLAAHAAPIFYRTGREQEIRPDYKHEFESKNIKCKLFISYDHSDENIAHRLAKDLSSVGVQVWIDTQFKKAGSIINNISKHIDECDILLLLWSKHARDSKFVNNEYQSAFHKDKTIIPCKLDETEVPTLLLSEYRVDLRNYMQGLEDLLQALLNSTET
ncbi:toll/interleukin-1 receptor domain-containing protein [candidate division KSB1 bacterium]|nr:toll/interleukin-1 receptor domain-containing protein [candidate division KSB1 bacterium]